MSYNCETTGLSKWKSVLPPILLEMCAHRLHCCHQCAWSNEYCYTKLLSPRKKCQPRLRERTSIAQEMMSMYGEIPHFNLTIVKLWTVPILLKSTEYYYTTFEEFLFLYILQNIIYLKFQYFVGRAFIYPVSVPIFVILHSFVLVQKLFHQT